MLCIFIKEVVEAVLLSLCGKVPKCRIQHYADSALVSNSVASWPTNSSDDDDNEDRRHGALSRPRHSIHCGQKDDSIVRADTQRGATRSTTIRSTLEHSHLQSLTCRRETRGVSRSSVGVYILPKRGSRHACKEGTVSVHSSLARHASSLF